MHGWIGSNGSSTAGFVLVQGDEVLGNFMSGDEGVSVVGHLETKSLFGRASCMWRAERVEFVPGI